MVTSPHIHCSIEDAKQKAERDRKMKLAEEKKQRVRQEVSGLRRQFYQVLMKSKELPAHLHLTHDEFILDPEMEEMLANQTKEKVGGAVCSMINNSITTGGAGTQGDGMGEGQKLYC